MTYTSYAINFPQISVEVDAAKYGVPGISPSAVLDAVGVLLRWRIYLQLQQYGKVYRVMMRASPEYRLDEQALNNMFVRNGTQMAPVSQLNDMKQVLGPETANRFNARISITANVNPADGLLLSEGAKSIEEVAAQSCWQATDMNMVVWHAKKQSRWCRRFSFTPSVSLCIYLILACLYESPHTVCRYLLRA